MVSENKDYIRWLRGKVGKTKIPLVYTSIVLRDQNGAVLLQRRADFKHWGLPGGILEINESLETCARRELAEESGLSTGNLRLVGVYSEPKWDTTYPNGDQVQIFTICFTGEVAGGESRTDGIETLEQRFFTPGETGTLKIADYYIEMMNDALAGNTPAYSHPYAEQELAPQIETVRKYVGSEAIIAPGATAVIQDDEGRLLMGKRLDDGNWDFPGGFLDIGENVAHTAVREAREETGLLVELVRVLGIHAPIELWSYPNGDQTRFVDVIFLAKSIGGKLMSDGVETGQLNWFTSEEVAGMRSDPFVTRRNQAVVTSLRGGTFLL